MKKAELEHELKDTKGEVVILEHSLKQARENNTLLKELNRKTVEIQQMHFDQLNALTYILPVKCKNCEWQGNLRIAKGRLLKGARCQVCLCHELKRSGELKKTK